ncbi:hypothetical protein TYRP_009952 [Tyrophagus putrescentiae]|nr:hypothetical protein TYRP_009952 [Tyrophagus putrescentiae]
MYNGLCKSGTAASAQSLHLLLLMADELCEFEQFGLRELDFLLVVVVVVVVEIVVLLFKSSSSVL